MDIKSYIDDLFTYLDTFETRYAEFKPDGFLQTYNGIYAVFQALRQQRDKAVDVDRYFLSRIQRTPLTSSDMRQLTIQILITFFESEADIDGQSNRSYLYCRDLRASKRDGTYFEDYLIPILFRDGSLSGSFQLNAFFLREIARYLNKFGKSIQSGLSPEDFSGLSDPMKFLELERRRQTLGKDLIGDRSSLEFHLVRIDAFTKLGRKNRRFEEYLTKWQYLRKTSVWATIKSWLGEVWGKIKGAFSSARYFRLVMTQRPAAYAMYLVIILAFIFLAVYVPVQWRQYTQDKLKQYQQKAAEIQSGPGK